MAIFNNSIVPASGAGEYVIPQSLRFNDDDSAYLSRTPASAGNRKTWTWSGWVKRGNLGTHQYIINVPNSNRDFLHFRDTDTITVGLDNPSSVRLITTQVFRDTAAWCHIVWAVDTTQATASDRSKLYVNGERITSFTTEQYPSQNYDTVINTASVSHSIGTDGTYPLDGYLSEVHFIDGQALTPSDFGEFDETYTTYWKPKKYTGTYGTNGFYLDFANSGDIGNDVSGNNNDWTPSGLSSTDVVIDTPTNVFATLNPLSLRTSSNTTFSEGNLKTSIGTSSSTEEAVSTMAIVSGTKAYFEGVATALGNGNLRIGVARASTAIDTVASNGIFYESDGTKLVNGTGSSYGATFTTGDVISAKCDLSAGTIEFYKNNVSQGSLSGLSTTEDYVICFTGKGGAWVLNAGQDDTFSGNKTSQGYSDANSQGLFQYPVPSDYLALCTANLADPAVVPSEHFNTVLYTGNGSTQSITGVGFQPEFTWIKNRADAIYHNLYDAVRGATKKLSSNATTAENTQTGGVTSFDTDGFSVGNLANVNDSSDSHAAWNWKANGAGVSNTDGSITSTVSANTAAGFSIVSYTGNATAGATVGHGLDTLEMIIIKNRSASASWLGYHVDLGATKGIFLNLTNAAITSTSYFNDTAPTSSVFSLGDATSGNGNGNNMIAYCFHSVEGYSKVGSYTGNGSTDGPFVHCGFRPAYVMIKRTDSATGADWGMHDSERAPYNVSTLQLNANTSGAEGNWSSTSRDFVSNGFKLRGTDSSINISGATYIFMAFAENPFAKSNAR